MTYCVIVFFFLNHLKHTHGHQGAQAGHNLQGIVTPPANITDISHTYLSKNETSWSFVVMSSSTKCEKLMWRTAAHLHLHEHWCIIHPWIYLALTPNADIKMCQKIIIHDWIIIIIIICKCSGISKSCRLKFIKL